MREWYTRKNSDVFDKEPKPEKLSELDRKTETIREKFSYKKSVENDLKVVNATGYGEGISRKGLYFNCQNCATAYELRRRGYDVVARRKEDGSNANGMEAFFKGGKFEYLKNDFDKDEFFKTNANLTLSKLDINDDRINEYYDKLANYRDKAFDNLCKNLSSQGYGARGIVVVGFQDDDEDMTKRTSCFHAVNYEVRDVVKFYDSQGAADGYGYGFAKDCADPRDYSFMRTDNLELSKNVTKAVLSRSKANRGV